MPIEINNTPFEVDGSKCIFQLGKPEVNVNGMIIRVFNSQSSADLYNYTDTRDESVSTLIPAFGSPGNPVYLLHASSSAQDKLEISFPIETIEFITIRLFITGSQLGNSFTEELLTTPGSGIWTKPAGVTQVIVECWGGGGAGGGATDTLSAGGGGAGGQYVRGLITYPSAETTVNYTIASSVAGTTGIGSNGNNTIWGSNDIVAIGGQGGAAGINSEPVPGGTGSLNILFGGQLAYSGFSGSIGAYSLRGDAAVGGFGGSGAGSNRSGTAIQQYNPEYGGQGGINGEVVGTGGANGFAGSNYAAGGGGAAKISGANRSGGNGAQGLIRLIYR